MLVIEAIVEELGAKRSLLADLAARQPTDTLLATNTSSLDLDAIAPAVTQPERFLGLHFFNPAHVLALVEVVTAATTSPASGTRASALMHAWGKTTVQCTNTPGFIVNRVARPFYGEAQRMLDEGVADAATIDACLRAGGFAMGPFELTDLIGQDVNLAVTESVWTQTAHDPRYAPASSQRSLVMSGRIGRKTGRGVFRYDDSGRALDAEADPSLVADLLGGPLVTNPLARTLAMLINEALDLVENRVATAGDVDIAMQAGTRYPRGPVAWGRDIGFEVVAEQIRTLDAHFPGGRYRVSPGLLATSRAVSGLELR